MLRAPEASRAGFIAPSLSLTVPQRITSCLHRSVAYATVNLAGNFEEMRPTGAEGSPPGNMPCPLAGAGSTSGTDGPESHIFPTAFCPLEKEQSQEVSAKSDRTSWVGDDLRKPVTFVLSVLFS
jgi:hypothetical protein